MDEIAKALPLSEGVERLVNALHRLGYKTAIISGGFQFFGEQLKARLGIDYVFANELPMDDGVVTGAVARSHRRRSAEGGAPSGPGGAGRAGP